MAWKRFLRAAAEDWAATGIDLLFPPQCPICRREPADIPRGGREAAAAPACGACVLRLSADVPRCPRCGAPSGGCRGCARPRPPWDRAFVLGAYGGDLREAVLRAKRPAGAQVAFALAAMLVRKHGESLRSTAAACVVPVPMHWWRRSLRGASAADDLACGIATLLGLPVSRPIFRAKATRMQNELPIGDRPGNVHNAFRARHRLGGTRVILVDDVMTTGATLTACCRALETAGARGIDVAVAARADVQGSFDDDA